MQIKLRQYEDDYEYDFIKETILPHIESFNNVFNYNHNIDLFMKEKLNIEYNLKQIITIFKNNLKIKTDINSESYNVLELDDNILLPNTQYKLNNIIRFISDGALDIRGTNYIKLLTNYLNNNLINWLNIYEYSV